MAGVPFDYIAAQQGLIEILTMMVGDKLGFLIKPDGSLSTEKAIYIDNQNVPEAQLPFICINYIQDNDGDGFLLDSGAVEVEDPNDPPNTIVVPYYDNYLNYTIMVTCEGNGSLNILREIKKKFLVDDYNRLLLEKNSSAIDLINVVNRSPQLLDTRYREQGNMILTFNTVDRYINFDNGTFNQMQGVGSLYQDPNESDTPVPVNLDVNIELYNLGVSADELYEYINEILPEHLN